MRKTINNNPVTQIAVVGVLAILVGFLLLTRVLNRDEPAPATTTPSATGAAAPVTPAAPATGSAAAPTAPAPTDAVPAAPATPEAAAAAAAAGKFVAGPGLPSPMVSAYGRGDTVVLYIARYDGVDDRALTRNVKRLEGARGVALFTTNAKQIADYSRIAQGVDVDRTPALVVLSPRSVSGSGVPVASVSYGFRGFDSIAQAVRDAGYKGEDLSYYPQ